MSGLEERLSDAVGRELARHGGDQRQLVGVRAAIVAGLQVLAEEFGPHPEDAAPPVHELPTEPGAVILVTEARGERFPTLPAMHDGDEDQHHPWRLVRNAHGGLLAFRPDEVTDWLPATVVPTAAHEATVKALRDAVTDVGLAEVRVIDRDDALDQIEERCKAALAAIEGATT